ncbi:hypothetical protein EYF80_016938 [Liparis tanakae]|uniref:Uncharacterized protein n=1 Tax=Liparis tanakae TaxID=230148 RepID=A0A4Z2I4A8_9TELE|nr:hypothetical protein EYF80_016938 [Liparis tanakae]
MPGAIPSLTIKTNYTLFVPPVQLKSTTNSTQSCFLTLEKRYGLAQPQLGPHQSKLAGLSGLGSAPVCGLSLTRDWAQKGGGPCLPIGRRLPLHFLPDLSTRHLRDSNYQRVSCIAAAAAVLPRRTLPSQ